MFVWSKLSSEKWTDAWEERFSSDPRLVITKLPGRPTARVEVYCQNRREAQAVQAQWGGVVRELKSRNWAAMAPAATPHVNVRGKLLVVAEKDRGALALLKKQHPRQQIISIPADMAFGTGHHATTATVLRLLVDFAEVRSEHENRNGHTIAKPWTMLDLGTGSGLLAIAAEKLGAARAWGCDYDEMAVRVARVNLRRNGTRRVTIDEADVLKWAPKEKYDCVAANLFHDILEAAFPKLVRSLKRDGTLFISGILRTQADGCLAAGRKAGLVFDKVITRGKWVTARGSLCGQRIKR